MNRAPSPIKFPYGAANAAFHGVNVSRSMLVKLKSEFDEYYLRNGSLFFDLKILMMTFLRVAKREVTH